MGPAWPTGQEGGGVEGVAEGVLEKVGVSVGVGVGVGVGEAVGVVEREGVGRAVVVGMAGSSVWSTRERSACQHSGSCEARPGSW